LIFFYAPPPEAERPVLVPLALFGTLLLVGRVIEIALFPAIGHWSDTTRTRWGRRLPFIVGGAPLLLLTFALLWAPPPIPMPWIAVYAFLLLQAYFVAGTLVYQPYEAVLAEITRDTNTRVAISAWKVVFGTMGAGVALVGSGALREAFGFAGMGVILGGLATVAILVSALGVRNLPLAPVHTEPLRLVDGLRLTATNRQFLIFCFSQVTFYFGQNMLLALLPFYTVVVLGQSEGFVGVLTPGFLLVAVASVPLVAWIARKRGKGWAYGGAMLALVVLLPGLFVIGRLPGLDPLLQGVTYVALLGMPMAAVFVLPNPIIGDIIDDDERRTGLRREGVYFGVEETINKLGLALSAQVFTLILATFGDSAQQPLGIYLIGPVAALGVLVGLLAFAVGYRVPESARGALGERASATQ
ncbi:MAG: MFS transporter, partial [Dehalococcoidia bacterium]|nr:MFS transporter [Dehalococcoidia bacterium]